MPLPPGWQHKATKLQWSTGEHGDESAQIALDVPLDEAVALVASSIADPLVITSPLGEPLWRGRIDDPSVALERDGGFACAALGGWAALSDLKDSYTALWSTTKYEGWRPTTTRELSSRMPDRYSFDTSGRLFIQPKKDATHGNSPLVVGALTWAMPHDGRTIVAAIMFDYTLHMPSGWQAGYQTRGADFSGGATPWSLNSTGVVQAGSVCTTASPNTRLEFYLLFNAANAPFTAADPTPPNEYGLEIANLRIVASIARAVGTALAAARAAGTNVAATVGTTSAMYEGQELVINSAGSASERVVVLSIASGTQFYATFAKSHAAGEVVQGLGVYGDEIAEDVAAFVSSVNPAHLAAGAVVSPMPGDLRDCVYEDATPGDVIEALLATQSTPWEAGVEAGGLYARPRGGAAQAWAIDVEEATLTLSLANLVNSAYAIYEDASGATLRTAVATDPASIAAHGLTRRRSVAAKTASAPQAQAARDGLLSDRAGLRARTTLPTITALYDRNGLRVPLWSASAGRGDTITVRNLPPELAAALGVAAFRITHTAYDAKTDTLTVEIEAPR